jgi:hypothetical protein
MEEIWLDDDPLTGIRRVLHRDPHARTNTIVNYQDDTAIREHNQALRNETPSGWKGDWHKVASIPLTLYFDLKKQGIIDDPKRFRKWLNDRENRVFRTKEGTV